MEQRAYQKTQRVAAVAFISTLFCVTVSTFPLGVAADVVRVQTNPLISQSRSCLPLTAYGFTPYIYDGELHSFEFTVPDRSYVALTGAVGNTFVPFQLMTRHGDANVLRVHVDIESIAVRDPLPISVTLISAKGGYESVCMSTVIMTASLAEGKHSPVSLPSPSKEPSMTPPASKNTGTVPSPSMRGEATTTPRGPALSPATSTPSMSMFAAVQNSIVGSCAMEGGATRLWIVLLALFVVVTGVAVLSQVPSTYSKGQRVASIVAPLVLLLAFWYLFESCRAALWAPLVALSIATLGILSLYWDDPRISGTPSGHGKPSSGNPSSKINSNLPLITPPPTKKQ